MLAAFHSYLSAIGDGNWAEACTLLSTPVKTQLSSCWPTHKAYPVTAAPSALAALLGHTPASLRKKQEPSSVVAVRILTATTRSSSIARRSSRTPRFR